ncbi:MAG: hypothetical protein AB7G23_02545 [Vicinamibacterales bacterium]
MDELRSPVARYRRWFTGGGARMAGAALVLVLAGSMALVVARGAGAGAPEPLAYAAASLDDLGRAVIDAMRAGDVASLERLALSEEEFRAHVWPSLPISEPRRNFPFDVAWGMLHENSRNHLRQTVAGIGREQLTLIRVEFAGATSDYGDGVKVYRDTRLVVRDAAGAVRTLELYGSTIEQDGRWKVFSYVVD